MDRWKAEVRRVREKKKTREDQRRERVRRKQMQVREKGSKVGIHRGFPSDLWLRRVEK